jgi:FAD/FMN-containing dehydrogenase
VVDLRALKDITVDENTNVARVGTGNRLGDVALALAAYDRGIPHGTCPYVGIGGHAGMLIGHFLKFGSLTRLLAHGGFGFPSRMWGLTLDNIKSVELVLPNGTAVKVSDNEQSDLFWVSVSCSLVKSSLLNFFIRLYEERVARSALPLQSNSTHTLFRLQA